MYILENPIKELCPLSNPYNALNSQTNMDLVAKALNEANTYNQALFEQQQFLLEYTEQNYTKLGSYAQKELQNETLARIERDLDYIQQLNDWLKPMQAGDDVGDVTWALKANKMQEVLLGAQELIQDPISFELLLNGQVPAHFCCEINHPVVLEDTQSIYGTSQSTYLTCALIELNLTMLGQEAQIQDLAIPSEYPCWLDSAAYAHVTPIDESINIDLMRGSFSQEFSFYFSDSLTPQGFAFLHSGYAFGGQRGETRFESEAKLYGPEDCSTWVAKLTDCPYLFSTFDQLYLYRTSENSLKPSYIDSNWLNSEKYELMQNFYKPVKVSDPLTDIQPGMIFAYRDFDSDDHQFDIGTSGHTGIVLGLDENEQVIVLCYGREMPEREGVGISPYDWESTPNREVMFFEVQTEALQLQEVLDTPFIGDLDSTGSDISLCLTPLDVANPFPSTDMTVGLLSEFG